MRSGDLESSIEYERTACNIASNVVAYVTAVTPYPGNDLKKVGDYVGATLDKMLETPLEKMLETTGEKMLETT